MAARGCSRSQELYGPHHGAQWSDGGVALGRRLMRVLPEDAFDRQPLIGGEGRYVLVADVRLDNRDELTEALRIPAPQARTLCDAAILLAAIERWDESCLERLVGDYAFAAVGRRASAATAGARSAGPAAAALSSRQQILRLRQHAEGSACAPGSTLCSRRGADRRVPGADARDRNAELFSWHRTSSSLDMLSRSRQTALPRGGIGNRADAGSRSAGRKTTARRCVTCWIRRCMQAARHWGRRRLFKRRLRQWSRGGDCGAAAGAVRPAGHRLYRCAARRL